MHYSRGSGNNMVLLMLSMVALFSSCSKKSSKDNIQDVSFLTSIYHPSFLFSKERNDTLSKTLKYTFNDWAVNQDAVVVFGLYDDQNQLINTENSQMQFLVNNELVNDGKIVLDTKSQSEGMLNMAILFSPSTSNNTFTGYIKVYHTDLDRINNINQLEQSSVLSWSANQRVVWNPLLKYLLLCLAFIVGVFLFWILFLRPIVYRRFGRSSLTIQSPFFKRISLNQAIKLTLDDSPNNQKWKERLMQGKKIQFAHPFFITPIFITPRSRSEAFIQLGSNYSIQPYTSVLKKGSSPYTLVNIASKEKITITFN